MCYVFFGCHVLLSWKIWKGTDVVLILDMARMEFIKCVIVIFLNLKLLSLNQFWGSEGSIGFD